MPGLPATIDPVLLAEKGARLTGALSFKTLPRLADSCRNPTGTVDVDLEFAREEGGNVRVMSGVLRAQAKLTCQRCLEEMDYELRSEPRVVLLRPGEPEQALAPEVDSLTVDKPVALATLVEDELLLVMPMIPLHDLEQCPARSWVESDKTETAGRSGTNPFAALEQLKRDGH